MDDGSFFVTDNYEHCVWKVTTNGENEKWVSGEPMDRPVGLCRNGADLLFADPHIRTISSLAPDKKLTVLMKSLVLETINVVNSVPLYATGSASD